MNWVIPDERARTEPAHVDHDAILTFAESDTIPRTEIVRLVTFTYDEGPALKSPERLTHFNGGPKDLRMFRNVLIFGLLAIGALLLLRLVRRPKRLFEIKVSDRAVTVLGPIPNRAQQDVREFVEALRLPVGARITAVDTGIDFRLVFSPSIRADDQDRLEQFIRQQ